MLIRKLTLRHFRNVSLATLEFAGTRQFLFGPNGQGKSNLLEAAGCLTALRSFRTPESGNLILQGATEAGISCTVDREGSGTETVTIKVRSDGKELWHGDSRVSRLADHVGLYPTVVFSSQDLQLVRGAPALRRRWLDLTLSAMDGEYLSALQTYTRALAGRNSLLRRPDAGSLRELPAFERTLAPAGARIAELRSLRVAELGVLLADAHGKISGGGERAVLRYESSVGGASAESMLAALEASRPRDIQARTTLTGPHRDDLAFEVGGRDARDFGSEGQQRSAMLSLRVAQASWFKARSGVRPVLLADDVLGELDPVRRSRFWAALDPESQVIATGTEAPTAGQGDWQVFKVAAGSFSPEPSGMGAPL
jgi:DNA replication and repair protein RecF